MDGAEGLQLACIEAYDDVLGYHEPDCIYQLPRYQSKPAKVYYKIADVLNIVQLKLKLSKKLLSQKEYK